MIYSIASWMPCCPGIPFSGTGPVDGVIMPIFNGSSEAVFAVVVVVVVVVVVFAVPPQDVISGVANRIAASTIDIIRVSFFVFIFSPF